MKKILITGISGFVGGHLCDYLISHEKDFDIHGISRSRPAWDFVDNLPEILSRVHFHQADLTDIPRIHRLIREIKPDYIVHLASLSSVDESWKNPVASFVNNTNIFLNILDTVRHCNYPIKILSVGSSEEYGIVREDDLPLSEDRALSPANPYAVARVAQENLARIYTEGYGLNICSTRSFNHCGPGQSPQFVIGSITKQFALIAHKKQNPVVTIGNGSIVRDFLDIRDVVSAYALILEQGKSGDVYNVCSGRGIAVRDIVTMLSDMYCLPVSIKEEPVHFRPIDNPRIIGTYQKIHKDLGWYPSISFEDSLRSICRYWSGIIRTYPYPPIFENYGSSDSVMNKHFRD
jgi:GDP-4-dehydro-6-deoxy-D-mannose reductase